MFLLFYQIQCLLGYNNICIKDSDKWKATFITPLGLCKPTVMFFSLWIPPNLSSIHEFQFHRLHSWGLACHLYGWLGHWCWFLRRWGTKSTPRPATFLWPWTILEAVKMRVQQNGDQVPWHDSWKWLYLYGPCQAICYCNLAPSQNRQSHPLVPQLL